MTGPAADVRDRVLRELAAALAEREAAGLRRRLRLPEDGVDLVSNDYLGLRTDPRLGDAMAAAAREHGAGAGGSRLLRGHHRFFADAEERLAAWCGMESALLFGSGYSANLGLLQALAGPGDLVVSDELNHASIVDGIRLSRADKAVWPHGRLDVLEDILCGAGPRRRVLIVTESVFSMDGDLTPLPELVELAERFGAAVIVDEAHATGLFGSGRVRELGLEGRVLATMHTGGKALGSGGAWVAGPREVRDTLLNHARSLVFSTAPLPVLSAALLRAIDVVQAEPWRVQEMRRKSALLRDALGLVPNRESPIVPVVVGENDAALALQEGLAAAGFDARAVRPPTVPPGTARLRVTVRVPVADEDLLRFADTVRRLRG